MKGLLINSQKEHKPVMIFYIAKDGSVSQRIITVQNINDKYIKAYCHMRHATRIFNLENILSAGSVKRGA